ncbi:hypothetical protein [Streptomyces sp. NPDC008265]|uniref:hypothetical protein n=1 Tax=Streptomyces sp. NPDC008265 TaxID=3364824 RepID=UPI0036E8B9B7
MAGNALTPRETAVWDQLLAELRGRPAATGVRERRGPWLQLVLVVLLPGALTLLAAGSLARSEALVWSGVILWVSAVLIISRLHGHGPRLPARRQAGAGPS